MLGTNHLYNLLYMHIVAKQLQSIINGAPTKFWSLTTASLMQSNSIIYIALLAEGTPVWRPVAAQQQADGTFLILEQDVPEDEQWQFLPGERVMVEVQEAREIWIAGSLAEGT